VGILPNRIIQPLAEHSEYPIEALGMCVHFFIVRFGGKKQHILIYYLCYAAFSNDKKYLGSISHDKMLKVTILSHSQLLVCPYVGLT
jgi:hypothetical protein